MNKKGFTIIELIVVIAIIAVLAGVVLVNVQSYIQKSKDAALLGEITSLQAAATAYYADNDGSFASFCGPNGPSAAMLKFISEKAGYSWLGCYSINNYYYHGTYYVAGTGVPAGCTKDKWWGYACKDQYSTGKGPDCYCFDSTGKKGLNPNGGAGSYGDACACS